jgi:hypothetical protein
MLPLVLFSTLGQTCDDLCDRDAELDRTRRLCILPMRHTPTFGRRKDYSGVESYKGRRFATSTGSGKSVFVFALMSIGSIPMTSPLMN